MEQIKSLRHQNSYFGNSLTKLFIYNLFHLVGFFKRRGPKAALMRQTREHKNSKNNRTALVLGSGPSLDLLNPDKVREYFDDVYVINGYYKCKFSDSLIPDYYTLSDPNFFVSSEKVVFHENSKVIDYLSSNPITLVIPHLNRKQVPKLNNRILYFDDRELPRYLGGGISPLRPRSYVSLTLYKSLAMAVHMGYKEIYVLGLDNSEIGSYRSDINNLVSRDSELYFAKSMSWDGMPKRSNPEKLPGGIAGQIQSFALFFGDLFQFGGKSIFNLDENSLVDAFPKVSNHPALKPKTINSESCREDRQKFGEA